MTIRTKTYKVTMTLDYDYDDSWVSEWEDNGDRELNYLSEEGVVDEILSWLTDLGFDVKVTVKDISE